MRPILVWRSMRRLLFIGLMSIMAAMQVSAAYSLTASGVTIEDMTVDKNNFFVLVNAATSSGEYEVGFDVWPASRSAIGSFSTSDKTIAYVSSYVHKTKSNGSAVNMWYYPEEDAAISLSIVQKDETTCTLSGSITASRNGTAYTYTIGAFDFEYSEEPIGPDPEKDPYRFEPSEPTTVNFIGDVVAFRNRETYIEVTLNEMANETYDWIELRLLSDTMAMPAGVYTIDDSNAAGTLTASKGYLGGTTGDDPCYVAIRADKENWGQYTPYYLASGSIHVNYNSKGDTIFVTGTALSHNGSTINVDVKSYNMLYVEEEQPKEPEHVVLSIDTVMMTYMSNLSDSANNIFVYTFNFSHQDDYPQVLTDVILSRPMELVAGTYSIADGTIDGLILSQNQDDFEMNLFGGGAYDFTSATLTLTPDDGGRWTYTMHMEDIIGSTYDFSFTQAPHIILYPEPAVDPEEQPYIAEQKEKTTVTIVLDTLVWDSKSVSKDGIIDIYLTQMQADINGLRAYIHLGMYAEEAYPEAGIYPVNGSEADNTFSASLGRYGEVTIPCYVALIDEAGYALAIWYIVSGDISLSYEGEEPILSGECTSYYGSTIRFAYQRKGQGVEDVRWDDVPCTKVLREGQIYLMYGGRMYDVQGRPARY